MELRILTIGPYRPYVSLIGRAGGLWDVVTPAGLFPDGPWRLARLLPPNMRPQSWPFARQRLAGHLYDLIVCHDVDAVEAIGPGPIPMVAVQHTTLDLEEACGTPRRDLVRTLETVGRHATIVYASAEVAASWPVSGETIPPGLDVNEYDPYEGDLTSVLVVGNLIREVPLVSGYSTMEPALAGLPLSLIGFNPGWPLSRVIGDRAHALDAYRRHRVFLHTGTPPYGMGCSVAMLEAMATGTPIVSTDHPWCPVENGVSGYVARDPHRLNMALLELLEDRSLAVRLGQGARATVAAAFSIDRFVSRWRAVFARVAPQHSARDAAERSDRADCPAAAVAP